jgi:hypothetical protein
MIGTVIRTIGTVIRPIGTVIRTIGTVILLIRRPHAFPGATSRWSHSVVATVRT